MQVVFTGEYRHYLLDTVILVILANTGHTGIAPDKDWRQLVIYPPLFGLIGYFNFLYWVSI